MEPSLHSATLLPDGLVDVVALTQGLVRCPSVTPRDEGALDLLQSVLERLGFTCHRLPFSAPGTATVDNLFARLGTGSPHVCFAGHTDVVPVGHPENWHVDPFGAVIEDGVLFGRGAADMKGAIAAFAGATSRFLASGSQGFKGSLSFLITGDEEGPAINGTVKVLEWMKEHGHIPDMCLVGEPTNPSRLGEMIKIGRRGSFNAHLVVHGHQGHVAYPHLADNPIPGLVRLLDCLGRLELDDGTAHFQPSNLEITNIEVGNGASNVIPGRAEAAFNIRFNDLFTGQDLEKLVRATLDTADVPYELDIHVSGEAFLSPPGPFSEAITGAIKDRLGRSPSLSTTGGTSDARFIKSYCTVAEFGLVGASMHKSNEHVALQDLAALADIYHDILAKLFAMSS